MTRLRIRSLLRDCRGSAVVEMALVGPVFILLMLVVFELGYCLFAQSVLDGATRTAARQIRTGQVQTSGTPLGTFQAVLCSGLNGMLPCGSVQTDVESFQTFSSMSSGLTLNTDSSGNMTNNAFAPGSPSQPVAVRVAYNYHFFTPWVAQVLSPGGSNNLLLLSTVIFRNEPF
ncbi:MAG: TadE/TadG family type IV pilus assembly protein [Roseiarcus sp.]